MYYCTLLPCFSKKHTRVVTYGDSLFVQSLSLPLFPTFHSLQYWTCSNALFCCHGYFREAGRHFFQLANANILLLIQLLHICGESRVYFSPKCMTLLFLECRHVASQGKWRNKLCKMNIAPTKDIRHMHRKL